MNQKNEDNSTGIQTQVDGGTTYIAKTINKTEIQNIFMYAIDNLITNDSNTSVHEKGEDLKKWDRQKSIILELNKNEPKLTDCIKKAYTKTIPDDTIWRDFRQNCADINDILKQIEEIPNSDSRSKFIYNLLQDQNFPEVAKASLQSIENINFNYFNSNSTLKKDLNSYLLIRLRPEETGRLFARAWFIPDDTVLNYEERFKPLTVSEQATEVLFEKKTWSQLLSDLIQQQCIGQYLQGQPGKLTIEVFLPREHLRDEEVEKWEYVEESEIGKSYPTPIGSQYGVVVRYYYRLQIIGVSKYRYKETQWRNNWRKIKNIFEEKIICSDEVIATVSLSNLCPRKLRDSLVEQIILKVNCDLDDSQRNDLLDAIDIRATPIVLWSRKRVQSLKNSDDFDKLLKDGLLKDLPERVRKLRHAAKIDNDEMHLGNHLVLLWDDPNRLPKDPLLEPLA